MAGTTPYVGEPVLQLLAFKCISNETGVRYRLLLSDGQYLHSFCVLSVRLNHLMFEGKLTENAIIKVLQHRTPFVHKIGCADGLVFTHLMLKLDERSMISSFFFKFQKNSVGRRIFVIFELEILKPGNEIDFLIGQPGRANGDLTNRLSELVEGLTIQPPNNQYDPDDDSIHFREFDELDIFRT